MPAWLLGELVVTLPFFPCGRIEEGVGGVVSDEFLRLGIEGEVGVEILRDRSEGEDLGQFRADGEGRVRCSFALTGRDEGGKVVEFGIRDGFELVAIFLAVVV